jgi:glycerol-3-phosphate dehydrogenase
VNRKRMLEAAADSATLWDIIIIGGGATGLGVAVDAAARGYRTLLLEKGDFASSTSSRSTKLIHGGVRYLQQGNIKLVREALHERGLLLRHAPHLVHPRSFVIPNYSWWDGLFYGTGLTLYDAMSGRLGLGRSQHLSRQRTLDLLPTLREERLVGGTLYRDAQFDDARLAIALARTAAGLGATVINYTQLLALIKEGGRVCGVVAEERESGREYRLRARAVVNATGVLTDSIRQIDDPSTKRIIVPSQGAHIVLPRSFLPGDAALMVPKTDDKRVLFAIPWHDRVIVGTTETAVNQIETAPRPFKSEIDFLLEHLTRYLSGTPGPADILSTFAGLRPLVKPSNSRGTALIPRDHFISVSKSGLVTVTGGKWTTYRKMAEQTVGRVIEVAGLTSQRCRTENLPLHGCAEASGDALSTYGSDAAAIRSLARELPEWNALLHPAFPYIGAEVIWAARNEMARTVEDVLARRTRALFLDARASIKAAPAVASLLARELGHDCAWAQAQAQSFAELATRYLPESA